MLYPPGFYFVKKPKRFVLFSSDKSSERNLSSFFDIKKLRRIEHLQSEEPFSSDLYFSTWIVRRRRWDTIGKVYRLFSTRRIDTIDSIRVPGTIRTSHRCGGPRGTPSWAITSASGSGPSTISWCLPTLPVTWLPTRARQLPIAWAGIRSSAGSWARHLLHLRLHQCVNFGTVWMVIVGRTICKKIMDTY